jgi:hypothetical protein
MRGRVNASFTRHRYPPKELVGELVDYAQCRPERIRFVKLPKDAKRV